MDGGCVKQACWEGGEGRWPWVVPGTNIGFLARVCPGCLSIYLSFLQSFLSSFDLSEHSLNMSSQSLSSVMASASNQQTGPVAEALVDLMHQEIVRLSAELYSMDADQHRRKMYLIGRSVGYRLTERFTRVAGRGRIQEELDMVKFLCRDVWSIIWKKNVDNLRTNHKGLYNIQDNAFRWILRAAAGATPPNSGASAEAASASQQVFVDKHIKPMLFFPCGLIEGVMKAFGRQAQCIAELIDNNPQGVVFTLKVTALPNPPA